MSTPTPKSAPAPASIEGHEQTTDHIERLALRPAEAAEALGVSERKLWELSAGPDGPPVVRLGRAVLYPLDGLRAWLAAQTEGVRR